MRCPFCGKASSVWADGNAHAGGLWVKCKNPVCKREFEIKI
nr:MAG TPA: cysteine-rich protein [Caudoviricetes sp.]